MASGLCKHFYIKVKQHGIYLAILVDKVQRLQLYNRTLSLQHHLVETDLCETGLKPRLLLLLCSQFEKSQVFIQTSTGSPGLFVYI